MRVETCSSTHVYSDERGSYYDLGTRGWTSCTALYVIRNANVDGALHTNGIESFWSLLKRGIKGI